MTMKTLYLASVLCFAITVGAPSFGKAGTRADLIPSGFSTDFQDEIPAKVKDGGGALTDSLDTDENGAPVFKADGTREPGIWGSYKYIMEHIVERALELDLYGVTSQLPQGVASFKWDWGVIAAKRRFDSHRKIGPLLAPFEFQGKEVELNLSGSGGGHTFQFSYGIIDDLDWYFELPFTYMDVSFKPNDAGSDVLCNMFPLIGRPAMYQGYSGSWLMGDINTGFSWNLYRNSRFSVALTPRVFLPTAKLPDPNRSLTYGMGPELETGIGGWAVGFTQGYDLRIFPKGMLPWWMDIIASTEFGFSYAFEQEREYPWKFNKPAIDLAAIDPDFARMFPDLSHIKEGDTFTYRPGMGMSMITQLQLQLAIFGLGFGYGFEHSAEAEFGSDTDAAFQQMADALELTGTATTHAIQVAVSISLIPLYIPAEVAFQWRKVVDGYNSIIYDDFYQLTVKGFFPVTQWFDD